MVALLCRRRRLLVAAFVVFAGCRSSAPGRDQGAPADLSTPSSPSDLASTVDDLSVPGCVPTNGGVEICDGLDNDCNGVVDDVAPARLIGDPKNCGACGHSCDLTAMHELGACVGGFDGGTPACVSTGCEAGYVDLHDPANPGCNYKCTPTNGGVESCDGLDNDCNGIIDDGFGYPSYNLDKNNCGACGTVCALPGAVAACKSDPMSGKGVCGVDHCINDGSDTYRFDAALAGGKTRDQIGCNYHCATASTTVTTGSNDCDDTTCAFPPEVCDGVDNDCNFIVDDNPTDVGDACGLNCPGGLVANCVGACKAGTVTCNTGVKVCTGSTGPMTETCDGVDNDCNGTIDDGFGYPNYNSDPNNCGSCGHVCNLAHATNKCVTDAVIDPAGKGVCEVQACNTGFNYAPLSPRAGDPAGTCTGGAPAPENGPTGVGCYYTCPVSPLAPESCDGKDNNCDGCVDNGLTAPANLCANVGVCQGQTIPVQCTGASGWKCNYSSVPNVDLDASGNLTATEKECDGLDNNCNGVKDTDGFPTLGNACSAGIGACQVSGTIQCNPTNKLVSGCFNGAGPPVAVVANVCAARDESCNGKDDDCDGAIDERTPVGTPTCYTDNSCNGAHACKGWVDPMVKVTTVTPNIYIYEYEASRPDATATSPGGNSVRACSNVGVEPWSDVTKTQAAAACAAIKDSAGAPMRLCTDVEWQDACEGPAPPTPPMWSMSQTRNTYLAKVCNDTNNLAPNAVWATATTGSGSAIKLCYTDWSSVDTTGTNRLYDLSGNVQEWTSTTVTSGSNTYFVARGGNYSSPSGGTTCEFDFDVFPATFADSNLGFRCCAANAP